MYVLGNISEEELINRCKLGDREAFSKLMRNYKDKLYGYIFRFTYNKPASDDILQEVLIKIWKGFRKYDEKQKFSSWVFTIAHNAIIDQLKTKRKYELLENLEEFQSVSGSDPHESFIEDETAQMIERVIYTLPEKQREVFVLRKNSGMTFKEIAELTGEPLNTVLGHMHYAVKKLRVLFEEVNEK